MDTTANEYNFRQCSEETNAITHRPLISNMTPRKARGQHKRPVTKNNALMNVCSEPIKRSMKKQKSLPHHAQFWEATPCTRIHRLVAASAVESSLWKESQ
eukprot:5768575-Karenia_brevis.AAC.1